MGKLRNLQPNTLYFIMEQQQLRFWETKSLKEMTRAEWESLCDHCGLCCLHSVQDGKTGKIKLLAVACQHLDTSACRCMVYEDRSKIEPDCLNLSPNHLPRIKKLPYTCAYRSILEGKKLAWWHPLVSGDPNTVHKAGHSVKDKVATGEQVDLDGLVYFPVPK